MSALESVTEIIRENLRKEVEQKVHEQLDYKISTLVLRKDAKQDNVIAKLPLQALENELCEKYEKNIKHMEDFSENSSYLNTLDLEDYEMIIGNLNNDKSAPLKLRTLRKLFSFQVIDTGQEWIKLSKNLQYCLINTNNDLFIISLKIHYKIICLHSSSCEGYLSLMQGLELMFNNRCFLNRQQLDCNNKLHNRTIKISKVLLKTQNFMIKNCIQSKLKLVEETINTFYNLLCRGQENSLLLDFLSLLDSNATWFVRFCQQLQIRNIVFQKVGNFVKNIVTIFLKKLEDSSILTKTYKKTDVCKLSHCIHFLIELVKYDASQSIFPIKFVGSSSSITVKQLLIGSVLKINELQTRKNDCRKLFIFFVEHLSVLFDLDIINTVLEPLTVKATDLKHAYHVIESNEHVLNVLNTYVLSSQSIKVLFGYPEHFSRRQMSSLRVPVARENFLVAARNRRKCTLQILVDLAIDSMRSFINKSEFEHQVREVLIKLLHCCKNLFDAHAMSFTICNPNKLISCMKDFYETIGNYNVNFHYKLDLAEIMGFFIASYPQTLKIITNKSVLLHDIIHFTNMHQNSKFVLSGLLVNMANDKDGYDILRNSNNHITKPYLELIWVAESFEVGFLNVNDNIEVEICSFLKFLHIVSLSYNLFEALVSIESEGTVTENDTKPQTLLELLETSASSLADDICTSYVALLALRILLTNTDISLYLDNSLKLQVRK